MSSFAPYVDTIVTVQFDQQSNTQGSPVLENIANAMAQSTSC